MQTQDDIFKASPKPVRFAPDRAKVDYCLILQYHRIASPCFDPLQLAVEPHHFEKQIEYLTENFNVISIDEMKRHLETSRQFKQGTIVITFDGGCTDVLYMAKDVLMKYAAPATVFATSANILEGGRYWWKVMEDFLIANTFGTELELEIDFQLRRWPLFTQFDRYRAFDDLYSILINKTPSEQRRITEEIVKSLELHAEELDDYRTMSAQELKRLADGGLITIGGHTHNSSKLSALSEDDQIVEILKNKDILEEVLGCAIKYFSYPFESIDSRTSKTAGILQNAGYRLAFGHSYGTVNITDQTGRYNLPRVKVDNLNKFAFYKFLQRFFG
jgi:peptidoglycan/xylan/chitin deacetylase (PgdA/CDA1 family)